MNRSVPDKIKNIAAATARFWHSMPPAGKTVAILASVAAAVVLALTFATAEKKNGTHSRPIVQTRQQMRAERYNASVKRKEFPPVRYSKRKVCKAFGNESAHRPTLFECYTYNEKQGGWIYDGTIGYMPGTL